MSKKTLLTLTGCVVREKFKIPIIAKNIKMGNKSIKCECIANIKLLEHSHFLRVTLYPKIEKVYIITKGRVSINGDIT